MIYCIHYISYYVYDTLHSLHNTLDFTKNVYDTNAHNYLYVEDNILHTDHNNLLNLNT